MNIRSVRHRALLRLIEDDDNRELRTDLVRRCAGTWSTSVSGNWRLTFDIRQNEICDLDLEDYH
jgi:toxin HigB-1